MTLSGRNFLVAMGHPWLRALRRHGLMNERKLRNLEMKSFFNAGRESGKKSEDLREEIAERFFVSESLVHSVVYKKEKLIRLRRSEE